MRYFYCPGLYFAFFDSKKMWEQDLKKEDKLLLLIKVLSNNEILTYLHERLFKKVQKSKSIESIL